jgi:hypothetical protein
MSTHGPVEHETVAQLNALGHVIADTLPEGYGFTLLMFKFGEGDDKRMNYLSNAPREDMIAALKELIANFEGRVVGGKNYRKQ